MKQGAQEGNDCSPESKHAYTVNPLYNVSVGPQ